jgi:hypothetical protein
VFSFEILWPKKLRIGNGILQSSDMGPLVSEDQLNLVNEYAEIGRKVGKIVTGGFRLKGGDYDKGHFYYRRFDDGLPCGNGRNFGPCLPFKPLPHLRKRLL